ncbi:MAG TPA: sugar ABC transporter permease [Spirochaetia bacterium]|nr:sugar ABC transporter permease [Spirochaetia bacterium]
MDSARHGEPRRRTRARIPAARARDALAAWLFVTPSGILIAVFGIFPLFFTIYVSLFKWRLTPGAFLGLGNFAELFGTGGLPLIGLGAAIVAAALSILLLGRDGLPAGVRNAGGLTLGILSAAALAASLPAVAAQGDKEVFDSLRVTVWYALLTVPVQLAVGLSIALLLTRKFRGRQVFRVIYLLPYVAPTVATAAIFQLLFSLRPDSLANQVAAALGSQPLQWLQEPKGVLAPLFGAPPPGLGVVPAYWMEWVRGPSLALVSIIFYSWWVFVGYYALIYINGLSAIPRQLFEAAEVDGAGKLRTFFSITLPLLSPTTYFLTLLGVIGTFKAFTHLYVLRSAAAGGTTDSISIEVFFTFFRKARLGYASAISIVLFLTVLGLTLIQQRTLERRVTYGD